MWSSKRGEEEDKEEGLCLCVSYVCVGETKKID